MRGGRRVRRTAAAGLVLAAAVRVGAHAAPAPLSTPPPTPSSPSTARSPLPRATAAPFRSVVRPLTAAERAAMTGPVWRPGCPVGLDQLRAVEFVHWDMTGATRSGVVVMHRNAATVVVKAFAAAYAARIPIAKAVPIEAYGGDDDASTRDDNTAGFNCRPVEVTGSTHWSQHAYGKAIDINPVENPYVYADGHTLDPAAQRFADRTRTEPGMLRAGDPVELAFRSAGWGWGGRWRTAKDYQHFSSTGH